MNIREVYKKAISTCKRNVTGRQKGGVLTRMVKMTGSRCRISVDEKVPTACWSWGNIASQGRTPIIGHRIKLGTNLDKICNADTASNERKFKKFVEAVIRHETEHGIQTIRDSKQLTDKLASENLPFRLWNLFEDCRIEYKSATRPDGDGAFRWTNYQDVKPSYSVASSLLLAVKKNEAGIKKQPSAYVPQWTGANEMMYQGKPKKVRLIVLDFYRRIIACADSLALVPILIEWVDLFGREAPQEIGDNMINGTEDPNAKADKDGDLLNDNSEMKHGEELPADEWDTKENAMNHQQINRIANAMKNIINKAQVELGRLSSNGRKLHPQSAMQGSDKPFLNRKRKNGKRSVCLIVDQSASMQYTWRVDGGKEFIIAFKELANRNLIDVEIILSRIKGFSTHSHRVSKRATKEWINNLIPCGGAEGLMSCMRRFLGIIKQSTTTVIFTDSRLRDNDIDTQKYRNMGINAIATYIETDASEIQSGRERMDKHFGRSVIASDPVELAQRLIREILKD